MRNSASSLVMILMLGVGKGGKMGYEQRVGRGL